MRALTVRQPWAWAIIHGGKDVENRSRSLGPYRGPVAIHAGLEDGVAPDGLWLTAMRDRERLVPRPGEPQWGAKWQPRGVVIGVVDLVDVHAAMPDDLGRIRCATTQPGDPWGMACSEWAMETAYHLILTNPRPLAHPIPWRGAQGLWTVPADLEAAIWEQVTS